MSNGYFHVAQILATFTGFMFLLYGVVYSSVLSSLSESSTAIRHSSDMLLNFPQLILTLRNLNSTANDMNFTTAYMSLYLESRSMELDSASSYAKFSDISLDVSNKILITASVFTGMTLIIALLGFFYDMLGKKEEKLTLKS
jgi:hypothetical protein